MDVPLKLLSSSFSAFCVLGKEFSKVLRLREDSIRPSVVMVRGRGQEDKDQSDSFSLGPCYRTAVHILST